MDGRPTKENPIPVLNMGYTVTEMKTPARRPPLVRKALNMNTPIQISASKHMSNTETTSDSENYVASPLPPSVFSQKESHECPTVCCTLNPNQCYNKPKMIDSSTQTIDIVALDHSYGYMKRTRNASCQQTSAEFSIDSVASDSDAKFYTGLSLTVLLTLIQTLSVFGKKLPYKLKIEDQILSVLLRLRLGLTFSDLGRRFNISTQLMSSIFHSWINIMAKHLYENCVMWLPRDTIRRTLPSSFKDTYPKTTCIIDCSEIFIQRPVQLKARGKTWSTYKNNNTGKFLIAIAPNGFIMFVSPLFGGRASDNYITKHSGFLDYLLPGDEVMADRGFTISEDLCARRVKLNIPAFMKGRDQLSEYEVIDTRRIASNRIHVERAIMRMKSYRILNTKMSNKSLRKANKTLCTVAAICNLRDQLIKDDSDSED